jgi:hypothetical protein
MEVGLFTKPSIKYLLQLGNSQNISRLKSLEFPSTGKLTEYFKIKKSGVSSIFKENRCP